MEANHAPKRKSLKQELDSYGNSQTLHTVNRDGDHHFIECPECHSTDLKKRTLFACRDCMTHFSVHEEDGLSRFPLFTEMGSLKADKEITVVMMDGDDFFWYPIYGRNSGRIDELKEFNPQFRKIIKDLRKGSDAHGHSRYKRFAIIPLD